MWNATFWMDWIQGEGCFKETFAIRAEKAKLIKLLYHLHFDRLQYGQCNRFVILI